MKTPDPRDKINVNRRLALGYQYGTLSTVKLLGVLFNQQKYKCEKDLKLYCGIKEERI